MKTLLSKFFLPIILMAFTFGCATAPAVQEASRADNPAVVTDIAVRGDTLSIACSSNFVYTIYSANDPYMMTIEIPDMRLGKFKQKMEFDNSRISEIIPQQTDSAHPSVKLQLTLQTPSTAVPSYKDNTLVLLLKNEQQAAPEEAKTDENAAVEPSETAVAAQDKIEKADASPQAADVAKESPESVPDSTATDAAPKAEETPAPLQKASEITGIELKRADGAVDVVITGNGSFTPNVFPLDGRIVIDIPSVSLKAPVPQSVIHPLKGIRTGKHKEGVRIVLDLKKKTHYDVSAEGSSVVIALESPKSREPQSAAAETAASETAPVKAAAETPAPPKETVTKEAPSESTAAKSAPSPAPAGKVAGKYSGKKISLDFQDAEIGSIFRLLADVNGYNLVLDPSVRGKITIKLMNVPWDQALDIILNTFNLSKSIEGNILWIAPTNVFAKIMEDKAKEKEAAEKAEPLVQDVIRINYATAGDISGAITQGKLLSPRGSITIDSRMNTLIVKDTASSIKRMKDLIKIMDVSKPQVMIEAKLVQVSTDYTEALGISWGGNFSTEFWNSHKTSGQFSVNTPTAPAGPNASVDGGALNMTIGRANAINVNLSLSALESIGKSKTLSNPRVLTMDNEAASIQQGRTFYIPTTSQAGTQTQQETATLSLNVTPKITPDGYVQLKVQATDNSLEPNLLGGSPVVDTKSVTTQALVKNGETLVLGGIYTTDESKTDTQVPLLGRIPGLGWLFKTRNTQGPNVKELLIFITPTILSQAR